MSDMTDEDREADRQVQEDLASAEFRGAEEDLREAVEMLRAAGRDPREGLAIASRLLLSLGARPSDVFMVSSVIAYWGAECARARTVEGCDA